MRNVTSEFMQEVIGEVLLYQVPFVAAANHEIGDAMVGVDFQDVPEDGLPADFYHGLGPHAAFFADAGAVASC